MFNSLSIDLHNKYSSVILSEMRTSYSVSTFLKEWPKIYPGYRLFIFKHGLAEINFVCTFINFNPNNIMIVIHLCITVLFRFSRDEHSFTKKKHFSMFLHAYEYRLHEQNILCSVSWCLHITAVYGFIMIDEMT